jgi:hypothetical protein
VSSGWSGPTLSAVRGKSMVKSDSRKIRTDREM